MSDQLTLNAYNISRFSSERFDYEEQVLRMNKLRVHLENCYGIKSLDHEFDFSQRRAWAIYAPNGCMKSSLALTFKDMANVRDRVHLDAKSVCSVVDENGKQLSQADIVVLERVAPGINLEHKIVLSIAIRIAAERFMVAKLDDDAFVEAITKNQTHELLEAFKKKFPMDPATQVLNKVLIMTPENIHLNAFMYEPIVDMSDDHLKALYGEVTALN